MRIDLNCDVGEHDGDPGAVARQAELFRWVTSANVACGLHAGGPAVMRQTIAAAAARGVAIGAHPGHADRADFGRRVIPLCAGDARDLILYQLGALAAIARDAGQQLTHVKPHGALYHQATSDADVAEAIATAVVAFDQRLALVGLPHGELLAAGRRHGLRTAREAFADRCYEADGSLTPRGDPAAVLDDPTAAAAQCLSIVAQGQVRTRQGTWLPLTADTICVHGDTPRAREIVRAIRLALQQAGITVGALTANYPSPSASLPARESGTEFPR